MTFIHGSLSYLQVLWLVLYCLALKCAAMHTDDLDAVLGESVRVALMAARIAEKEAAILMGWDESSMRKALRGERGHHISLNRLARLPFLSFWFAFSPSLLFVLARRNMVAIAEDLKLTRSA